MVERVKVHLNGTKLKANGAGRPSGYKPELTPAVERACMLGATDQDLAIIFGKTVQTIYNWRKEHPEFFDAIKRGKLTADTEVAATLYKKATGWTYEEEVPIKLKFVDYHPKTGKKVREYEKVERVTVIRVVHPDTTAIIFFLKNRRPAEWRDVQRVEHAPLDPHAVRFENSQQAIEELKKQGLLVEGIAYKALN